MCGQERIYLSDVMHSPPPLPPPPQGNWIWLINGFENATGGNENIINIC